MTPEAALVETVRFTAVHAARYPDDATSGPWLVTGAVLMTQQAAALALRSAGDAIPALSSSPRSDERSRDQAPCDS